MAKEHVLQDVFLDTLCKNRETVNVYLVNGIRLQGRIEAFDRFVVMVRDSVTRMVYKHAISTIVALQPKGASFQSKGGGQKKETPPSAGPQQAGSA